MRRLDGITDSTDMNLSKLREMLKDGETWRAVVHGVAVRHNWVTEQHQECWHTVGVFADGINEALTKNEEEEMTKRPWGSGEF